MGRGNRPKRSKQIPPPSEIKDALKQAPDKDLIDEAIRRGLISKAHHAPAPGDKTAADGATRFWETPRRGDLQERQRHPQCQQEGDDIDSAIAALRARAAHHHQYVGQFFDVLRGKRLNKMQERGVQRTDTTPEFAALGKNLTKAIFDHLVIARQDALDEGACDIESLWEYFMSDAGYRFATCMVKGDMAMPPNLYASFIYQVVQGAAMSFLDVVEEDAEEEA
jgi:hypothetical protein